MSQFSVFPEKIVGLSDGERYFTFDMICYLPPTQLLGSAVPCDATFGNSCSNFESPAMFKVDMR